MKHFYRPSFFSHLIGKDDEFLVSPVPFTNVGTREKCAELISLVRDGSLYYSAKPGMHLQIWEVARTDDPETWVFSGCGFTAACHGGATLSVKAREVEANPFE